MNLVIHQNGDYEAVQIQYALYTPLNIGNGRQSYAFGGRQEDVVEIRKSGETVAILESVTSSMTSVRYSDSDYVMTIPRSISEQAKETIAMLIDMDAEVALMIADAEAGLYDYEVE